MDFWSVPQAQLVIDEQPASLKLSGLIEVPKSDDSLRVRFDIQ